MLTKKKKNEMKNMEFEVKYCGIVNNATKKCHMNVELNIFYFRRAERINDNHTRMPSVCMCVCAAQCSCLLLTNATLSKYIIHISVFEHIVCFHFVCVCVCFFHCCSICLVCG